MKMEKYMPEFERVNYHGHCDRCRHAMGDARDYAGEAIKKGLVRMGFSDHLPFPDNRFGLRMPFEELEEYLEEIADLKGEMRDSLDILCGFEGEYIREDRKYYEWLLHHKKCDYLLLGQHFYEVKSGQLINVYQIENTEQYEEYSTNVVEAMKTGYFRYAAHPDIIFLNNFAWDIHCERACDILIEGALKYHFALEYNANGFRRKKQVFVDGERYPYPHDKFWDRVADTEIEVYVGSDCHEPCQVYDTAVIMSYENLKKKGIIVRTDW